jgi:Ala-tRNA(Pro) deacylase
MMCLERLSAYLRENCVPYTIHHHPAACTALAIVASEHILPHTFAKVVMVFIDGRMAMLAVPADTRADLARLANVIGAHEICLADEHEFCVALSRLQTQHNAAVRQPVWSASVS